MKARYPAGNTQQKWLMPIDKRSAYNHAGQAAAIYLSNKQKQLPAVHFQIVIEHKDSVSSACHARDAKPQRVVSVEGGRLIQSLPLLKAEALDGLSNSAQKEYRLAFEADIVNILAGPLAEAKYCALRENQVFNPNLVYLGALKFYGGRAGLSVINEYLEGVYSQREVRDPQLVELFLAAYSFVNNQLNLQAITALAVHILDQHHKHVIDCNDVIALLEASHLALA